MPIDLVIDDREGGSKSDSEEITRSSVALDQVHLSLSLSLSPQCVCVCVCVFSLLAIQLFWVTTPLRCYLHMIKAVLHSIHRNEKFSE